ncbi:hypothetical protein H4219_005040 [Mycoemilia scoparia]|uniref:Uncharacterized protein n=1 Tax=Mycoemilia scoparia TaxID=417184 RepID=A0A9W7ZV77_9FUNG|nr:hypothetical protein H4219_005040 [Mycoemilia scoparia]
MSPTASNYDKANNSNSGGGSQIELNPNMAKKRRGSTSSTNSSSSKDKNQSFNFVIPSHKSLASSEAGAASTSSGTSGASAHSRAAHLRHHNLPVYPSHQQKFPLSAMIPRYSMAPNFYPNNNPALSKHHLATGIINGPHRRHSYAGTVVSGSAAGAGGVGHGKSHNTVLCEDHKHALERLDKKEKKKSKLEDEENKKYEAAKAKAEAEDKKPFSYTEEAKTLPKQLLKTTIGIFGFMTAFEFFGKFIE